MLAKVVTFVQMSAILFLLAGPQLCDALGIPVPAAVWGQLQENKAATVMGAWLIGNMLNNALTSTGAFEVLYGSDTIFSKLESGRMPGMQELVTGLQEAIAASQ